VILNVTIPNPNKLTARQRELLEEFDGRNKTPPTSTPSPPTFSDGDSDSGGKPNSDSDSKNSDNDSNEGNNVKSQGVLGNAWKKAKEFFSWKSKHSTCAPIPSLLTL
jgi:hypothetical protein